MHRLILFCRLGLLLGSVFSFACGEDFDHGALEDSSADVELSSSHYDVITSDPLKAQLSRDYGPRKSLSYKQARQWIFLTVDNEAGVVTCVYTGRQLKTSKIPPNSNMNVEHTWSQSLLRSNKAKADIHHLFPTDSQANSRRGNMNFGDVVSPTWRAGQSELGRNEEGKTVFEPPAGHHGDAARALFYIATMYHQQLHDDYEALLREWNRVDPPDADELARNDRVEAAQGNRNPFIDDSSLVDSISDF